MDRTTRGAEERKTEDERMTAGQSTADRPAAPAPGAQVTRDKGVEPSADARRSGTKSGEDESRNTG